MPWRQTLWYWSSGLPTGCHDADQKSFDSLSRT
jgi:hypothetical protein